jgi:hypothetical protein
LNDSLLYFGNLTKAVLLTDDDDGGIGGGGLQGIMFELEFPVLEWRLNPPDDP